MKVPSVVLFIVDDPSTGEVLYAETDRSVPIGASFSEPKDCPVPPSGFRKRVKVIREVEV